MIYKKYYCNYQIKWQENSNIDGLNQFIKIFLIFKLIIFPLMDIINSTYFFEYPTSLSNLYHLFKLVIPNLFFVACFNYNDIKDSSTFNSNYIKDSSISNSYINKNYYTFNSNVMAIFFVIIMCYSFKD